ncbi:MAG: hypothetical protein LBS50_00205 [Prevotellaceae bacterium]|jgi:lipopolysaccharide export system protein LptA|nr:hypothetical protein [Prevotellaceae bacterium]
MKYKLIILFIFFAAGVSAQNWYEYPPKTAQDTVLKPVVPQKYEPKTAQKPDNKKNKSSKITYIYIENANIWEYDQVMRPGAQLLQDSVIFRHDGVFLYCDSAYFYEADNSFNAYGNVVINQGDTLFCYGDVLYYDGNTKLARLRHNVMMDNLTATLITDSLNYDRAKNIGYYFNGGVIQDTLNTLSSETGYYYPATNIALFRHNVTLENPDFTMTSDTLKYNTTTKVASIVGPTNIIYDKETHIYSEYGWYNTENEQSKLLLNSWVMHNSGKKLVGDTIFYDKKNGKGEGFSNVEIVDTVKKVTLAGNYGYYIEQNEIGLVTDSAMMTEYSSEDTLFLHADTLYTHAENYQVFLYDTVLFVKIDTALVESKTLKVESDTLAKSEVQKIDSVMPVDKDTLLSEIDTIFELKFDTVHIFRYDTIAYDSTFNIFEGYPNVRFFRTNVQGVCDSSYYDTRDSVLHLLKKPIIWSDNRQLTGDTIRIFPKNGEVERAVVTQNAFVCEFVEEKHYNQLSGKEITGYIVENLLKRVDVKGNAETLYYAQEEADKSIIGLTKMVSSIMNMHFTKEREIERIVWLPKPSGSMFPLKDVKDDMLYLGNYSWQISKKPISKFDIFRDTNAKLIADSIDNQDNIIVPKKKTTRREDVKPIEDSKTASKDKKRTSSTDSNRPSGFATPNLGSDSGNFGNRSGSSTLRKQ